MNKKLKITLLSILSIIIALGAAWSGWMIGEKNSNQIKEKTEEKISQEMEVYFYRTDGIYKITSSDEKPQQIVKTTFDKEQHWSFTSQFEIMGEKNNWLVYRDKVGENPDVKQIELGLMVYDVNEQKEIMSVKEDNSSVTNFIISPEKKSIAYVLIATILVKVKIRVLSIKNYTFGVKTVELKKSSQKKVDSLA